ncbi:hypothetical protein [Paenibacillus sp. S150]|uniref:hypothetical protein n=1 Tax=Paenibacillus sp. S150 TaxID=2749826 RepID=UPI001C58DD47|nr:hypothetical protein [Paenibacillus sp. S150]MBW4081175.1 hypothetical protein [Paenibacillus sp. S150]
MSEFAQELKLNDNTLYNWLKKFGADPETVTAQVFKSDEHQSREITCVWTAEGWLYT